MDEYEVAVKAVLGTCALLGLLGGGVVGWRRIRQALAEEPTRKADVERRLAAVEETMGGMVEWRREHMGDDRKQHGEILEQLGGLREKMAVFEAALPVIERIPALCETVGRIDGRMDVLLKPDPESGGKHA